VHRVRLPVRQERKQRLGTYFKVPNAWRVYDENAFIRSRHLSPTKAKAAKADSWTVAFDASSKPSLKHFNQLATKEPFGIGRGAQARPTRA